MKSHRFTAADGSMLSEFGDHATASRFRRKLEASGTPYHWHAWGGPRTGWNSVTSAGIPAEGDAR